MKRFSNLTPKIKVTLVKTLLMPILEYPPIPLCSISLTQKRHLQIMLHKALRFVNKNETEILRVEELHSEYNITRLNIILHERAPKIWETIRFAEQDHYESVHTLSHMVSQIKLCYRLCTTRANVHGVEMLYFFTPSNKDKKYRQSCF